MRKVRNVLRLAFDMGASVRLINHSTGVARGTVSEYLTRFRAAQLPWPLPPTMDDAELERKLYPTTSVIASSRPLPDFQKIYLRMKLKGATLEAEHEKYLQEYPDGLKRSRFNELYAQFVGSLRSYLRQTYTAGERVCVDYAGPTIDIYIPGEEQPRKAQVFVGVLSASRYMYVEAMWSQKIPDWINCHCRMFAKFGGVTEVIICDNLKSAVTKPSRTEPVINGTYQAFADHYKTVVVPARVRKPKDKAHAENGVLIAERWIIYKIKDERFASLEEANARISELVDEANARKFQKLSASRNSLFESLEKPALRPLPMQPFEYVEFRRVRVGMNSMFTFEDHEYNVPAALVKKEVDLRITTTTIEVLYHGKRVISHARSTQAGQFTIDPSLLTPTQKYYHNFNEDEVLAWAQPLGESIYLFFKAAFAAARVKEQKYRLTIGVKKLLANFGANATNEGCKHALDIQALKLDNLNSILINRQAKAPEEGAEANFTHENIRGAEYYSTPENNIEAPKTVEPCDQDIDATSDPALTSEKDGQ